MRASSATKPLGLVAGQQSGPLQRAGVRSRAETVEVDQPQVEPRIVADRESVDQRVQFAAFVPKSSHGRSSCAAAKYERMIPP